MQTPMDLNLSDLNYSREINESLPVESVQNACFNPPFSKQLCEYQDQYQSHEPNPILACFAPSIGNTKLFRPSTPWLFQSTITGAFGVDLNQLFFTIPLIGYFFILTTPSKTDTDTFIVKEGTPYSPLKDGMIELEVHMDGNGNIKSVSTEQKNVQITYDKNNPGLITFTINRGHPYGSITFTQRVKVITPLPTPIPGQPKNRYIAFVQEDGKAPVVITSGDSSFIESHKNSQSEKVSITQRMRLAIADPAHDQSAIICEVILLSDRSMAFIYFDKNNKSQILPGSTFYRSNGTYPPTVLNLIQEGDAWSVEGDYLSSFQWEPLSKSALQIVDRSTATPTVKLADEIRNIDVELKGEYLTHLDKTVLRYRKLIASTLQSRGNRQSFSATFLTSLQKRESDDLSDWFRRARPVLVSIARMEGLGVFYNQEIKPLVEYLEVHLQNDIPIDLNDFPSDRESAAALTRKITRESYDQLKELVSIRGRDQDIPPRSQKIRSSTPLDDAPAALACFPTAPWNGVGTPEGFSSPKLLVKFLTPLNIGAWSKPSPNEDPKEKGNLEIKYLGTADDNKFHFLISVTQEGQEVPIRIYLIMERERKKTLWQKTNAFVQGEESSSKLKRNGGKLEVIIESPSLNMTFDPQILTFSTQLDKRPQHGLDRRAFISEGKKADPLATACFQPSDKNPPIPPIKTEKIIAEALQSQVLRVSVWEGKSLLNSEQMPINVNIQYLWSEGNLRHYCLRFDNGIAAYLVVEKGNNLNIVEAYIGENKASLRKVKIMDGRLVNWVFEYESKTESTTITLDPGVLTQVISRDRGNSDRRFILLNQNNLVSHESETLQSLPDETKETFFIKNEKFKQKLREMVGTPNNVTFSPSQDLLRNVESFAAGNPDNRFYKEYVDLRESRLQSLEGLGDSLLIRFVQIYASLYVPENIDFKESISNLLERSIKGAVADAALRGKRREEALKEVEDYLREKRKERMNEGEKKEEQK